MNPQTNYDRIKNMSIEEMAEFFGDRCSCDICPVNAGLDTCPVAYLKWLESEAEK